MKAMNKAIDIALLGLLSLTVHRVRSLLTVLGILFGVWSVIAMLAISEGAAYQAKVGLREMGANNIIIRSIRPVQSSSANEQARGTLQYGLLRSDVAQLRGNLPNVVRCAVTHNTNKYVNTNGKYFMVTVIGTEPAYGQVMRLDMRSGRFLSELDLLRQRPHCVITKTLAEQVFAYHDPLGKILTINEVPMLIVGVLNRLPAALAERDIGDPDRCAMIPITTDFGRYGEFNIFRQRGSFTAERVEVNQLILQMGDETSVRDGSRIALSLLLRSHPDRDFEVKVPLELMEQIEKQSRLWSFVFLVIASVSLLVGGIGIMNIMLASVTERTREIGIRRALGAKRRDIVVQFLVEAITLTTAGGLVGIAVGMAVPWGVEKLLSFRTILTGTMLLLPFVMAVVVGLVSGLYPAFRAARLDPITALRHE